MGPVTRKGLPSFPGGRAPEWLAWSIEASAHFFAASCKILLDFHLNMASSSSASSRSPRWEAAVSNIELLSPAKPWSVASQSPITYDTDTSSLPKAQEANMCSRCWPLGASELGYCICSDLALAGILPPATGQLVFRRLIRWRGA